MAVMDEEVNGWPWVLVNYCWFGVNAQFVTKLAPEVMQFGGTLPHLLWLLCHADQDKGPVFLAKFEIAAPT